MAETSENMTSDWTRMSSSMSAFSSLESSFIVFVIRRTE